MKWHFKTKQGIKNFTADEADEHGAATIRISRSATCSMRSRRASSPSGACRIQIMPEEEAENYHINPFDLTKVWPHADYPLIEVGEMELNRNPENYFAEVEQAAFRPVEHRSRHGLLAGQDAAGAADQLS